MRTPTELRCGMCLSDPVRKGATCCAEHGLIVCSACKGTDRYLDKHPPYINEVEGFEERLDPRISDEIDSPW